MTPFPRTGSYLVDSMLFALRAILFTLAAGLAVALSVLALRATMLLSQPYTGSSRASSLLALLVFVGSVGAGTYLLVSRTDVGRNGSCGTNSDGEGL